MTTHIATKTRVEALKFMYPRDDGTSVTFADNPELYRAAVDYLAMQEMEREVKAAKTAAALDLKEAMKLAREAIISIPGGSTYRITHSTAEVDEYVVGASIRRSLSVKVVAERG